MTKPKPYTVGETAKLQYLRHKQLVEGIEERDAGAESYKKEQDALEAQRPEQARKLKNVLLGAIGMRSKELISLDAKIGEAKKAKQWSKNQASHANVLRIANNLNSEAYVREHLDEYVADARKDAEADGVPVEIEDDVSTDTREQPFSYPPEAFARMQAETARREAMTPEEREQEVALAMLEQHRIRTNYAAYQPDSSQPNYNPYPVPPEVDQARVDEGIKAGLLPEGFRRGDPQHNGQAPFYNPYIDTIEQADALREARDARLARAHEIEQALLAESQGEIQN